MATKENELSGEEYWLSVIGKSLAVMCLHNANLQDASIGVRGELLTTLGLKRKDIAVILKTTEATVRVEVHESKKAGRSKLGKRKAKDH